MKIPIGSKIAVGFGAALLATVLVGAVSFRSTRQSVENAARAAHGRKELEALKDVLSLAQDLETGARGYVVTGRDEYLEPHRRAAAQVDRPIADLSDLTAHDPAQRERLAALKPLVAEKLAVTAGMIELRRAEGFEAASALIQTGRDKRAMEGVRRVVSAMEAAERASLDRADQLVDARGRQAVRLVALGSLLGVVVVVAAGLAVHRDMTKRRCAEAERDGFFTLSLDLLCIADAVDGRFRRLNPAWESLGYTADHLTARPYVEFVHDEDREATLAEASKLAAGGITTSFENRYRCRDGSYRWLLWHAALSSDGRSIFAVAHDVTERKRAEDALRDAKERLRLLVEGVRDYAIFMLHPDGRVASWNAGAERIKGYRSDEIVGQHFSRFYLAEDVRRGRPATELRVATETGRYEEEGLRVRKDGSTFWANVVITAVRDDAGRLRGFAKVTRDVTDRRRAEDAIRDLNANLRQHAAQLEAANRELEAFCYSVSHDLRAPLRSIDGFSQALLEDHADKLDDDGRDSLNRVRAATQRMGQLIDDLLNLSRVTRAEMSRESVDLTAMGRAVVEELRRADPERSVEFVVAEGLVADADPRLVRVVLNNLIGNAWKFTGKTPGARIEFGCSGGGANGDRAYFVRDNGAGFDPAYAAKLFGAFQRLHAMHEFPGTGVGLATVQRIVHRHGGRVAAEGRVGGGATFTFTF